ncbi:hypothetical protein F5J12DRAFT_846375 [Pisolithus orientalis]|uniref:uncharacterized protein n=1 Tax=Pisolithus orientalis TaxID=936130 RepID=UPI0022253200|nr:uncharacterized protein F5J12DRAFT_846375 [Pisolithus orientalis]KAI6000160.1 hypothetical protein F5J12DRAFT_846375 [Pisolithus orientalis]
MLTVAVLVCATNRACRTASTSLPTNAETGLSVELAPLAGSTAPSLVLPNGPTTVSAPYASSMGLVSELWVGL